MASVTRQKQVGDRLRDETRVRVLDAAAAEFAASGYSGATVTRIAERAGVTVQTLYHAWGSKRALLRAHTTAVLAGGEDPTARFAAELEAAAPENDPARIDALADIFSRVASRAAGVWQLHRDAAAVDPLIAADWQDLQLRRRRTIGVLLATIVREDRVVVATDTVWVIASPESHDLLVSRAGYSAEEYREWLRATLRAALRDAASS